MLLVPAERKKKQKGVVSGSLLVPETRADANRKMKVARSTRLKSLRMFLIACRGRGWEMRHSIAIACFEITYATSVLETESLGNACELNHSVKF